MARRFLSWLANQAIQGYRFLILPFLGTHCRFVPSCSRYASEAIAQYGFFRGGLKTFLRLLRCHPFHSGGFDPVSK